MRDDATKKARDAPIFSSSLGIRVCSCLLLRSKPDRSTPERSDSTSKTRGFREGFRGSRRERTGARASARARVLGMGCLSSKESKIPSSRKMTPRMTPGWGPRVVDRADEGKKICEGSRGRVWGGRRREARPIGRSFHEDIPSPVPVGERAEEARDTVEGRERVADVAGSDDELEAQLRAPSALAHRRCGRRGGAAAGRKKKKDKNRLTDLEDYDLGRRVRTTEEMLRKRASRGWRVEVMQKVFSDSSDGGCAGRAEPHPAVPLTGPGAGPLGSKPLSSARDLSSRARAPKSDWRRSRLWARLRAVGRRRAARRPRVGSFLAPVRRANSRPITPIEPEPVVRRVVTSRERNGTPPNPGCA